MTNLDGRSIYISTGRLTQSINVCDTSNRQGHYDWKIRITEPFVNEADVAARGSIEALLVWLRGRGGIVERQPEPDLPASEVPPAAQEPADGTEVDPWAGWIERAVQIVEQCIDRLVTEFLEHPHVHRVEHSVHAELFTMLTSHRHLSQMWPMADGNTLTQPLHKEWPETIPRPEKGNRRGNFDLAILSPGVIARCEPQTFVNGLAHGGVARPCIAIEAGLNYSRTHLARDADKLANSAVKHGYLVHLVRESPPDVAEVGAIIARVEQAGSCRVAYAVGGQGQRFRKLLAEPGIKPFQA